MTDDRVIDAACLPLSLRAWGKRERDLSKPPVWLPLIDHCVDVACVTEALLSTPVMRRRLARLGGLPTLTDAQVARLCVFAGLHDLGKANHGFQRKKDPNARSVAGHVSEALAWLDDPPSRATAAATLGLPELGAWCDGGEDAAQGLLAAAITHHGGPPREANVACDRALWVASLEGAPVEVVAALASALRAAFPSADAPLLPGSAAFQHAFSGLLMLADWLGSTRSAFSYGPPNGPDRVPWARGRARELVTAMGFDTKRFLARLEATPFEPRVATDGQELYPLQRTVTELPLPEPGDSSLLVLESETGSGKTEAALIWFLRLFRTGRVDGMYFALPTRSAATQIHQRICRFIEKLAPDVADRPPVVLAVPGYLRVDDRNGKRLDRFDVRWDDDPGFPASARGWAAEHSKRYLAGSVVIGTVDQVLLSVLPTKHAHLRATALLRHLLVVDEVHASDPYMTGLLAGSGLRRHVDSGQLGVLQAIARAGGHALLLSATLGGSARARLLGCSPGLNVTPSTGADVPYPWASLRRGSTLVETGAKRLPDKVVNIRPLLLADDPEAIAIRAAELASRGARVLVIRNLVKDCVATHEALERLLGPDHPHLFRVDAVAAPHHARFAADDRKRLDTAVEAVFGKRAVRGDGRVLVATQTVEQSLDIDADVLLTDLCPMDVLLQRIGRVHRHERARPTGFETAQVELLLPAEPELARFVRSDGQARGPHGYGRVYENLLALEATRLMVGAGAIWRIPQENRILVERGVDPVGLEALAGELGGPWPAHAVRQMASGLARGRFSQAVIEGRARSFFDPEEGWLARPQQPPEELKTRLGEQDFEVCFERSLPGPFGSPIPNLRIPRHLARDADGETLPERVRVGQGDIRFGFGGAELVYDRLGLRHVE